MPTTASSNLGMLELEHHQPQTTGEQQSAIVKSNSTLRSMGNGPPSWNASSTQWPPQIVLASPARAGMAPRCRSRVSSASWTTTDEHRLTGGTPYCMCRALCPHPRVSSAGHRCHDAVGWAQDPSAGGLGPAAESRESVTQTLVGRTNKRSGDPIKQAGSSSVIGSDTTLRG
ncbi:uncharacterized protein B0I36DRAFT_391757 [Microdochium trichocladiopsis]|uniref:Uncharacterized protein n=1 Tax=Microdochium trichocladiopsis TaxID=1682393 RepID=A0A9P8YKZ0_9PEZI|nr:uncharacterized protein B0I36DRAFT_391757 [Microdochium trichocladiopsis]KAH7040914.1 hypothetical protein B0I36DRAFT_391757 [Microdochium trichocladiopsis]